MYPGNHYDYLAVYNMSNSTMTGMDYILPVNYNEGLDENRYINLSCFNYKKGEDLSQYITDCTNRTSPSRFKDGGIWRNVCQGIWILKDVNVKYVHKSNMCTYGGNPLYQVILTYDDCFTYKDMIMNLSFDTLHAENGIYQNSQGYYPDEIKVKENNQILTTKNLKNYEKIIYPRSCYRSIR